MATKQEDAKLILRLYDLRREALLRQARVWFGRDFHPTSAASVSAVLQGEQSAFFRMVTSYWEMAATLVTHGAIDPDMFHEANGEHFFVFAKLEPFLEEFRKETGMTGMLRNLEKVARSMPNYDARLKQMQARFAAMAAAAKAQ